jgi:tight adherence protein B
VGQGALMVAVLALMVPPVAVANAASTRTAVPVAVANAASMRTASPALASQRTVMILLDTNLWMASERIPAERAAARAYLAALPAGVRAGLIIFADKWRTVTPPTADRQLVTAALAGIRARGGKSTGLAAAMSAAELVLDSPGKTPGGRVLVLSDAEHLTNRPLAATVPVDVVTWRYEGDDNTRALQALASASGGHVATPAHAAGLAEAFPAAAAKSAAPAVPAVRAARVSRWPLIAILACVFVALLLLALLIAGPLSRGDRGPGLVSRIERYGPRRAPAAEAEGGLASTALGWAARLLRSSNTERGLALRLDQAGIARNPADWALLCGCACLALAATLTLLTGNALVGIPIGVLAGWLAMRLAVSHRIGRRRAAFSEQLPDVLQLIAGSLQSGFSLPQALDTVVREDAQPAAAEFSRALAEARIGADLEDALSRVAERMDSVDLRWTVMAIRIQRDVGGNLAEVLRTTVGTMRERAYIRRQVRALSAEGRLSAYIVVGLPVLVGAWFFYSSPAYMRPLYTTSAGVLMLGGAVAGVVLGSLWMRKLINVEV